MKKAIALILAATLVIGLCYVVPTQTATAQAANQEWQELGNNDLLTEWQTGDETLEKQTIVFNTPVTVTKLRLYVTDKYNDEVKIREFEAIGTDNANKVNAGLWDYSKVSVSTTVESVNKHDELIKLYNGTGGTNGFVAAGHASWDNFVYQPSSADYIEFEFVNGPTELQSVNLWATYCKASWGGNAPKKWRVEGLVDVPAVGGIDTISLDFETVYQGIDGEAYYSSEKSENFTSNNTRGSHAELVTESDGNDAVRLTYDNGNFNENYKANPAMNIFNPVTSGKFVGTLGEKYIIEFDYKVENTDGKQLQLYVANCNRSYGSPYNEYAFYSTDMNLTNTTAMNTSNICAISASDVLTTTTNDYQRARVIFTADGTVYPIIALVTNGKQTDSSASSTKGYASVLIDNISVSVDKAVDITFYNYGDNGETVVLPIIASTTFDGLDIPSRTGYFFDGWYLDSELQQKADGNALVANYNAVYVKWWGDGTCTAPVNIDNPMQIKEIRGFSDVSEINTTNVSCSLNTYIEPAAVSVLTEENKYAWYGSSVLSADEVSTGKELVKYENINMDMDGTTNTILFYVEIPDYERSNVTGGLSLSNGGGLFVVQDKWHWLDLNAENNKFYYTGEDGTWVESEIEKDTGIFKLPSGFKGYIKIDLSQITYTSDSGVSPINLSQQYTFKALRLNYHSIGGECGYGAFGNVFYSTSSTSNSLFITYSDKVFDLSTNINATLVPVDMSDVNGSIGIRYSGTNGKTGINVEDVDSSTFWSDTAKEIVSASGKALTTSGYMNTYSVENMKLPMQVGVDSFVVYAELPEYVSNACGLKLVDTVILQAGKEVSISFSNSLYQYFDINGSVWRSARAGADGELDEIKSGFKGYIKFDLKNFKGYPRATEIDFLKNYRLTDICFGVNHMGAKGAGVVIGGIYSVMKDSDNGFFKNAYTGQVLCGKAIGGDVDCNGIVTSNDVKKIVNALLEIEKLDGAGVIRAEKISKNSILNITTLVRAKKIAAGLIEQEDKPETDTIPIRDSIFTADITTTNTPIIYEREQVVEPAATIEADTTFNTAEKAIKFAQDIKNNKVGDFEKAGIDQMCHVSTFLYSHGNIYVSYYANTQSAAENPDYQVARMAYCPENDTDKKVILDIQLVGDELCGNKVTGVYDTILMQKDDEPDNLYILWTASINNKYYRLYRIFNMKTETLGEICVNKFKVNDTVNDFSSSGIASALTANNIGYKEFFIDIGVMQKLSTRVENGETYYYTGAYSGNFTCIIKSKDLITWEYVAQPNEGANGTGFANSTKWENAVYVLGDKVYYFVRQWDYDSATPETTSKYGILTYYDLNSGEWAVPVLVGDCQSRSDFIYYQGNLYLFYAPTDREHIGILKIDTDDLKKTSVVLQADMNGSCFYPFVQYTSGGEKLAMSYTVDRKHIRLATFKLSDYMAGNTSSTPLSGKAILFAGDSIGAGWRDTAYNKTDYTNGGGWGTRIAYNYGALVTNAAIAGNSFTSIENRGRIVDQLHQNKDGTYDYVVIQGGFNDAMGENVKGSAYDNEEVAPLGTVGTSKELNDFDTTTFAGALEETFYYATQYFTGAKLGFIITYRTPCSQYGGKTADMDYMSRQWAIAKKACEKWNVECIDLFDGVTASGASYSDLLDVSNSNSICFPLEGDNIHLNEEGYRIVSPYIAEWLISMADVNK